MNSERQIRTLMLAHELEKTLGELYTIFAERFPGHRAFWTALAQEEDGHAGAVRKLYQVSYTGQSRFDEGDIKSEGIQSIVGFVKEQIGSAQSGRFTAQRALALTYDLERSLVEKDIFAHFDVASEYAGVLAKLKKETLGHVERAKAELDRLAGKS